MSVDQSFYTVRCLCHAELHPHTAESVCPSCGRGIVIEWGKDPVVVREKGAGGVGK